MRLGSANVLLLLIGFVLSCGQPAWPQETAISKYPSRPINFISPLPPGASADLSIRLIAQEAEKFLGQPVVVINKPGGTHAVGAAAIASAKPDGYTIGYTSTTPLLITPFLEKVPYDPLKDFQQIMQYGEVNFGVVVKSDTPFKSFKDLIAYARQHPGKVTFGTGGATSIGRLTVEQIARKEAVQFTHIPFKGSPETEAALLGGHIDFTASGFSHTLLEAGTTNLLLLFSEEQRAGYPQIPILRDLGYYFPSPMFLNVAGPKGLPKEVVKKLEDAFTKAMQQPGFINGMKRIDLPIVYRNSEQLTQYVTQSHEVFARLLKELGLAR